ncbi:hypothetical protein ALP8811_00170 [Aliiroseovarius pelagivivens]|uniref:Polyprenol-phosphate-mannose-dependent alpha-(1-2)-phosphatidylinositol mannoside mannosyltransferase n=1 Tax=Aliiroseovarius pelagivivens TaxID=1639690 RepID=A0A2R8AGN8_9RHOB|nr:glycosyltransferase family 87 protein [Aliiroseovarius pelagivivens]SPF75185.1 hypothetical protein ALP8811_00170 [Aliiroseovarius pelagivivens]
MVGQFDHANTSAGSRQAYTVLLVLGVALVVMHWGRFPPDFSALYFAGQFYGEGAVAAIYPQSETFFWDVPPPDWRAKADAASELYKQPARIVTPYIYPPLWVVPLSWLSSLLDFRQAAHAMLLANVAALLAMVRIGYDLLAPKRIAVLHWVLILSAILLTSTVSRLALHLGQPQIFVSFLTLLAFADLAKNRPMRAGGWLALAASIKLAPALFVVIFIMERNWKAAGSFVVIGGVLAAMSILTMGWPLHDLFLTKLSQIDGQVLVSRLNLSLELGLLQLDHLTRGAFSLAVYKPDMLPEPAWVTWATRALLLGGLVVIYVCTRSADPRFRIWSRLSLVALLLLLTSPLGWLHYMILPLMLLPGVLERSNCGWGAILIAGAAIGYALPLYLQLVEFAQTFLLQSFLYTAISLAIFATVLFGASQPERQNQ